MITMGETLRDRERAVAILVERTGDNIAVRYIVNLADVCRFISYLKCIK